MRQVRHKTIVQIAGNLPAHPAEEQLVDAIVACAVRDHTNVIDIRRAAFKKRVTQLLHDLLSLRDAIKASDAAAPLSKG